MFQTEDLAALGIDATYMCGASLPAVHAWKTPRERTCQRRKCRLQMLSFRWARARFLHVFFNVIRLTLVRHFFRFTSLSAPTRKSLESIFMMPFDLPSIAELHRLGTSEEPIHIGF